MSKFRASILSIEVWLPTSFTDAQTEALLPDITNSLEAMADIAKATFQRTVPAATLEFNFE